ncbi:MAG: methyl-accepting chemotaxis protein [Marinobacter sp.]|uniref:methyl-accepting chemotaxis protein n=1 Tax=Marinobacter sp. TaxID=50741 RepID=UPI0029AAAC94|nr:methyl-accepting chemotaxis protein [Marinobacter sp.]
MAFPSFELTIRARVILLFTLLIGLSVFSSAFVYRHIAGIGDSVDDQVKSIAGQTIAINDQSGLIDQQRALGKLSERVTIAQQHLGAMQYWYFHAALNADMESLDKAQAASEKLIDELGIMASADESLEEEIAGMTAAIDQYQTLGQKMFEFFEKSMMLMGRSMAEAARQEAVSLTAGLDNIRAGYQLREMALTEGVLEAGDSVREASNEVAMSGGAIRGEIDRAGTVSLIMAGVLVLSALLMGTLFLRSLLRPVRTLGQRIEEIQADNDLRGTLGYKRNDELSVVTRAFDQMLSRFGGLIGHVAKSTAELGDVAARGRQSSQSLAEQVGRQEQETNLVATAANEVTATAEEVRRNADQAARLADEIGHLTHGGGESADEAVAAMARLESRVETVAATIGELASQSQSIGQVMDVIRGISEKTNLLALNAAIEAARAGEMGRGFAIVADEVRGLASQTANSTEQIDDLVSSLQGRARNAVDEVEAGRQESRATVTRIQQCSENLRLIDDRAGEMRSLNQQVAQAAAEQSDAVSKIDENLINLKCQIEEISGNARTTDSMTDTLASLSEVLRSNIRQFRY